MYEKRYRKIVGDYVEARRNFLVEAEFIESDAIPREGGFVSAPSNASHTHTLNALKKEKLEALINQVSHDTSFTTMIGDLRNSYEDDHFFEEGVFENTIDNFADAIKRYLKKQNQSILDIERLRNAIQLELFTVSTMAPRFCCTDLMEKAQIIRSVLTTKEDYKDVDDKDYRTQIVETLFYLENEQYLLEQRLFKENLNSRQTGTINNASNASQDLPPFEQLSMDLFRQCMTIHASLKPHNLADIAVLQAVLRSARLICEDPDNPQHANHLLQLAKTVSGKELPVWKKLGTQLALFGLAVAGFGTALVFTACPVMLPACLVIAGALAVLFGSLIRETSKEKGLASVISKYRDAAFKQSKKSASPSSSDDDEDRPLLLKPDSYCPGSTGSLNDDPDAPDDDGMGIGSGLKSSN